VRDLHRACTRSPSRHTRSTQHCCAPPPNPPLFPLPHSLSLSSPLHPAGLSVGRDSRLARGWHAERDPPTSFACHRSLVRATTAVLALQDSPRRLLPHLQQPPQPCLERRSERETPRAHLACHGAKSVPALTTQAYTSEPSPRSFSFRVCCASFTRSNRSLAVTTFFPLSSLLRMSQEASAEEQVGLAMVSRPATACIGSSEPWAAAAALLVRGKPVCAHWAQPLLCVCPSLLCSSCRWGVAGAGQPCTSSPAVESMWRSMCVGCSSRCVKAPAR
jgi:hypothetical protein